MRGDVSLKMLDDRALSGMCIAEEVSIIIVLFKIASYMNSQVFYLSITSTDLFPTEAQSQASPMDSRLRYPDLSDVKRMKYCKNYLKNQLSTQRVSFRIFWK